MDSFPFVNLNDGSATRISLDSHSVLDLTFVSPEMVSSIDWQVTGDTLGSDHYAICLGLGLHFNFEKVIKPKTKWNDRGADWTLFRCELDDCLSGIDEDCQTDGLCLQF